jgi:hypothetical protein
MGQNKGDVPLCLMGVKVWIQTLLTSTLDRYEQSDLRHGRFILEKGAHGAQSRPEHFA